MAQTILLNRSSTPGATPTLAAGELGINTADELLFYDDSSAVLQSLNLANPGLGIDVPLAGGTMTGLLTLSGNPTAALHATTKQYVDALAGGFDTKDSVRVASTANVNLAATTGGASQDGITLADGEDILLKDQTAGAENGIYTATTAANPSTWVRRTDADTSTEVTGGMYVWVNEGTANGDKGFALTTNDPITLGTTVLTFTQVSGLGQITAGAGLTKTGDTIDAVAGTGITVNANDIQISTSYVGQTSITTLGTISTGTWNGTAIDQQYGGTGADLSALAAGALIKNNAGGTAFEAATEGTDFLSSTSTIDGGTF